MSSARQFEERSAITFVLLIRQILVLVLLLSRRGRRLHVGSRSDTMPPIGSLDACHGCMLKHTSLLQHLQATDGGDEGPLRTPTSSPPDLGTSVGGH